MRGGPRTLQPVSGLVLAVVLATVACGGGSPPKPGPVDTSFRGQFDFVWQTFDREYSYFIHKNIDWPALRDMFRPRAEQAQNQAELIQVLRDMLGNLHDGHVILVDPAGRGIPTFVSFHFTNFDTAVWQQQYLSGAIVIRSANGLTAAFLSGVAYIAIENWNSNLISIDELDAVLENFRNSPSIIIDVRNNPGGNNTLAFQFAGRFADRTRTAGFFKFRNGPAHSDFGPLATQEVTPRGPWQFTRPVQVLTGRRCASSCEDFVLAMRELPHVTVVGDTTAGSSGNPGFFNLAAGWQFSASRWIQFTAQMEVIEDLGIAPQTPVSSSASDFAAGRDPVLDFALQSAPRS